MKSLFSWYDALYSKYRNWPFGIAALVIFALTAPINTYLGTVWAVGWFVGLGSLLVGLQVHATRRDKSEDGYIGDEDDGVH